MAKDNKKDKFEFSRECLLTSLSKGDYFKLKLDGCLCRLDLLLPKKAVCKVQRKDGKIRDFVLPEPGKLRVFRFIKLIDLLLFND